MIAQGILEKIEPHQWPPWIVLRDPLRVIQPIGAMMI
jgi:hypothetical protein